MGSLFQEIKRRKVFRVAAIYAVVAWVLIQVADTIAPLMNLPESAPRLVLFLLIILFPIALFLAWAYEVTPEGVKLDSGFQESVQVPPPQGQRLILATFILVLLAVGFQFVDRFFVQETSATDGIGSALGNSGSTSKLSRRFLIDIGATDNLPGPRLNAEIALSPDGRRLVFLARRPGQARANLYIQELEQLGARILTETDSGYQPFFSPDGAWIGFAGENGLRKVSIQGGPSQLLTESIRGDGGGFWSFGDTLIYPSNDDDGIRLQSLPATGGFPEPLEPEGNNSIGHVWPWLLPDGDSLLFTVLNPPAGAREGHIDLLTKSSGDIKTLIQNAYNARYVPTGHIVFMRDSSLWAVPFDPGRLETTGPEVPVIVGVQTEGTRGASVYTFSNDGLLVYLPGTDTTRSADVRTLVWVDRDGNEESLPETREFRVPVVSPEGQRLAVVIEDDAVSDIWTYDLSRNTLSRLTFNEANEWHPLWSPSGDRVIFRSSRGDGGLWWKAADGTGQAEPLITGIPNARATSFTPDGSQLVYDSGGDIFLLTLYSDTPPQPLLQTEFNESRAAISPDGRWVAYESDETGQVEIYVRSFPDVEGARYQISNAGGAWPKWSSNGKELYFRTDSSLGLMGGVWATQVEAEEAVLQYATPVPLISGQYRGINPVAGAFDISADGSRFMLVRLDLDAEENSQTQLVAVENWFEELKRLAPPDLQ